MSGDNWERGRAAHAPDRIIRYDTVPFMEHKTRLWQ